MVKKKKKTGFYIFLVLLLVLAVVSFFVVKPMYEGVYKPNIDLKNKKEKYIYIRSHYDFTDVQKYLHREKIMKDTASFGWMARRMKYRVKPGKYLVKDGMNNLVLVRMLRLGESVPVNIAFRNIRFKTQVAGIFGRNLEADSFKVLQLLEDSDFMDSIGMNRNHPMTYFISDTYQFKWNTTAKTAIIRMKNEWDKVWTAGRKADAERIGLSPEKVMSLAAIVQEETARKDESARIAGVYLNRLKKGMKLQADPTVKYVEMKNNPGKEIKRIYFKSLKIDDPYNTYVKNGLPPGPIVVPEVWAIDAVLDAEEHNFIYFAAREDFSGYHNFSADYNEHEKNAKKYRDELDNRQIR
ncbi:MAG: endolytic transglycosylase MltG [Bacteroidia bacterium]